MMVAASAGVADSGILVVAVVVKIIIGSLRNDDGGGQKIRKKATGLDRQNNSFAHASCFLVH